MKPRGPLLRRLGHDRRGVSALEFALIAPILMLSYFAMVELCGAMLAERKASHVASAVGDLVAQVATISAAGLNDVFSISSTIVQPMSVSPLAMRVTSIQADAITGATKVVWSAPYPANNTALPPLTVGAPIAVPAGLVTAGNCIVKSEAAYTYTSPLAQMIPNGINFSEVFYLQPRVSTCVALTP